MHRGLLWVLVVLGVCQSVAMGQRREEGPADRVCQRLRPQVEDLLPAGVEVSLYASDARVYDCHVELKKSVDLDALLRGIQRPTRRAALDAWSARLCGQVHRLVVDAVRASGHDPGFNPGTDVKLVVCGHVLPEAERMPGNAGVFYWVSYTGTRRDPPSGTERAADAPPVEPPNGAQLTVTIVPDRTEWKPREKITGELKIVNTGRGRAHCHAWGLESLLVTDKAGKAAERFFFAGCILPSPDAPTYAFLEAGEVRSMRFAVSTDRLDDFRGGFVLGEGEWLLAYDPEKFDNTLVKVEPVPLRVRAAPGEYTGPRISMIRGCGPNIVLMREENWCEVIDGGTGKRLGTRRPEGLNPGWIWYGAQLRTSSDGRLIAFGTGRDAPIRIEAMFGEGPVRPSLGAPSTIEIGPGGFFLDRFLPGDRSALCTTNGMLVEMDLGTGAAVRSRRIPERFVSTSTDGRYGAWLEGDLARIVGHRGEDSYAVHVIDLRADGADRTRTVRGHGGSPTLVMGARRAYLSDEFESSVVSLSLIDGTVVELRTGAPADIIGESPDGEFVVLAWPRAEAEKAKSTPTVFGVFRTSDGSRVSSVRCGGPSAAIVLGAPARIGTVARKLIGDGWSERGWLDEHGVLYEARTGAKVRDLDLTPPAGFPPKPAK
jgi:hypothetical protein